VNLYQNPTVNMIFWKTQLWPNSTAKNEIGKALMYQNTSPNKQALKYRGKKSALLKSSIWEGPDCLQEKRIGFY
jgi:hypothetical protein